MLTVFSDIQKYLVGKISDDEASFQATYNGKYGKLLLWEFPGINILWLLWFVISLVMGFFLVISSLILFPILHMILRVALTPKSDAIEGTSAIVLEKRIETK